MSDIARQACDFILKKLGRSTLPGQSLRSQEQSLQLSSLFDQSFYEQQCDHTFNDKLDAIRHYLSSGTNSRFEANPLFDSQYYLANNLDVAKAKINPFVHFVNHGALEKRNPHECFDTDFYLEQITTTHDKNVNALEHFFLYSVDNHLLDPSQNFSVEKYYLHFPDVALAKKNALVDFLEQRREIPLDIQANFTEQILPDYDQKFKAIKKHETLILCSHDASRTGAPLIILKIAELLHKNYQIDCKILLICGGPLVDEFRKYGEVTILDDGRNCNHANFPKMRYKISKLIDSTTNYALCNSAESHFVISELAKHRLKIISLIHEFADSYAHSVIDGLYQNSDRVVLPSNIVLEAFETTIGEKLSGVEVLPQGIFADKDYTQPEFDASRMQTAKQQILAELKLPKMTQIILGSGYVDNRKGCDFFMLTCQMMQARYPDLNFAFIWVGQRKANFADHNFDFWLNKDIGRTGLENHLFFVGEKEDPTDFFLAADVFFMCSRLDPFPCVVLEALSAATPVICFDKTTGSVDLLTSGAGAVIAPFHLLEAVDAIASYLTNETLRVKAGTIGQNLIKTSFQYSDYVDELVQRLINLGFECPVIEANEHPGSNSQIG